MKNGFVKYLLFVFALYSVFAAAEPRAVLSAAGITITLFDEPCALTQVTNLPMRATWHQDGKTFEGCFGLFPQSGAIGAFFDDNSVAVIPVQMFRPVSET